ncbi:MAG: hypothetical protein M3317_15940 [Actinomycetota bacterium]|nr:hypothetical protein [Actinomycetota bacterium]
MLVAVCTLVVLFSAVVSLRERGDFSPGEELVSPGVKDIAVSQEDTMYPTADTLRFDGGAEAVYVYLRIENFAPYGDLEARVGRTSKTSALGRLLGGDGGLVVVDEGEDRLAVTDGRATGVVKFAVRPASGGRLPAGNYTVTVYAARENSVLARKYFVVGA